ncbi:hypothetical protein N0V84_007633 [Fusarium piperis]|uniref:Uncharacterized protein n=1 Tax=Fusarium piperis TaxID=1435070 RepID=A0A9W9BM03_9HYPO|nr:hypothetical protein N0V84_007633 [Fusarium piperis]
MLTRGPEYKPDRRNMMVQEKTMRREILGLNHNRLSSGTGIARLNLRQCPLAETILFFLANLQNEVLVAQVFLPEASEIVEFVTGNGFQAELSTVVEGPLVISVWVPLVVSNESLLVLTGVSDVMTSMEDKGGVPVSEGSDASEKAVTPEVVFIQITELEIRPLEIREVAVPIDIDMTDGVVVEFRGYEVVLILGVEIGMNEELEPVEKAVVVLFSGSGITVIVIVRVDDVFVMGNGGVLD